MSNDSAPSLSEETIDYLEEVKKGKPRKFAMICKGPNVVSLVVYKKGNVEKRRKEAKEQGKGQFYFGIVDGKGMDIRFVLARADGFESAPVKSTVLKNFLAESADLKFKPYFEIVDSAPLVLNEDDPLVARFIALQDSALKICDAQPDRAAEINALCSKIGKALDQELSDQALVDIQALEELLRGLGGGAAGAAESSSATSTAAATAGGEKIRALLSKLQPLLTQAVAAQPQMENSLTSAYSESMRLLDSGAVEAAQTATMELAKQLKELIATKPAAASEPADSSEAAQFRTRRDQVEQELLSAQRAMPDKSVALGNIWQLAMTQAEKGNYPLANKALDKLLDAIRSMASAPQDKWQGWQVAREQVVQQIRQVASAVAATKDPEAREVIVQLQAIIKNITLKPEGQAIAELRKFLFDDIITAAEEAPQQFGSLQIRQPLLNALEALEA